MTARVALLLLLAAPGLAAPAAAQEGAPETGAEPAARSQAPGLDSLLRPRAPVAIGRELRGGKDRRAWLEAFELARGEVVGYERSVAETQAAIRAASKGEWGYSPAGGGTPTDPEVLKLTARLKRDRQSLETARQRLRDLEVEASLLGVPDDWREAAPEPAPSP